MPTERDLMELIERLEAATGPDRELDWGIHVRDGLMGVGMYGDHPLYTASLDSAVALVERVLPARDYDLNLEFERSVECTTAWISHWDGGEWSASRPSAPLAICLALLRAVQAQREAGE